MYTDSSNSNKRVASASTQQRTSARCVQTQQNEQMEAEEEINVDVPRCKRQEKNGNKLLDDTNLNKRTAYADRQLASSWKKGGIGCSKRTILFFATRRVTHYFRVLLTSPHSLCLCTHRPGQKKTRIQYSGLSILRGCEKMQNIFFFTFGVINCKKITYQHSLFFSGEYGTSEKLVGENRCRRSRHKRAPSFSIAQVPPYGHYASANSELGLKGEVKKGRARWNEIRTG